MNVLGILNKHMSGTIWQASEKYLVACNKNLVTLASSAIVITFAFVKINNTEFNKASLILSWVFLLLVIILGSLIFLLVYFHKLSDRLVKKFSDEGILKVKWGKTDLMKDEYRILMLYFSLRSKSYINYPGIFLLYGGTCVSSLYWIYIN